MFKVVADQLKVSQGWVRCGHCAEVFDAATHLLQRESASLEPAALAPDADEQEVAQASRLQNSAEAQAPQQMILAPAPSLVELVLLKPALSEPDDAPDSAGDFDLANWKLAQQDGAQEKAQSGRETSAAPGDLPPRLQELVHTATLDDSDLAAPVQAQARVAAAHVMAVESSDFDALPDVSFVREARRKAFWTQPPARRSLAALSVLLLALLALQWVTQQKDTLAARDPRFTPLLQTLCSVLGCKIRPPRHIESLVIDSSSLNRLGPDAYRLNFSLKNTAAAALEMPSLEVTLTDAQDQALVRRVLAPALYGATSVTLAAHSELAGAVSMKVSAGGGQANAASPPSSTSAAPPAPLRVAGYRVLAFYP